MKPVWMMLTLTGVALNAHAVGRLADVQVVDRDTGASLQAHYFRGEYWIAGTPGDRYSVSIRNQGAARVLAVTSVDGINVISGQSASWLQTGYVFERGQRYGIDGWRKSDQEVAAFVFTAIPDSYAARTGRAQNVGVIGVALFLERALPIAPSTDELLRDAPAANAESLVANAARATSNGTLAATAPAPALGTGHGAREYSSVVDTPFERQSQQPNELIRIRYDSLDNLVALGVLPRPAPTPAQPNPFPHSPSSSYVPDPPS